MCVCACACARARARARVRVRFLNLTNIVPDKSPSVAFSQQRDILHNPRNCGNGRAMKIDFRDNGDRWRCSIRGCREKVGLRKGTWSENANLSLLESCSIHLLLEQGNI